jgi:hypothetical protein
MPVIGELKILQFFICSKADARFSRIGREQHLIAPFLHYNMKSFAFHDASALCRFGHTRCELGNDTMPPVPLIHLKNRASLGGDERWWHAAEMRLRGILFTVGALLALIAPPAAAQVRPKAVLQIPHPDNVLVWAWTPDSQYLLTFSAFNLQRREILIWDLAARTVIDRIDVPIQTIPLDFARQGDDQCAAGGDLQLNVITIDRADRAHLWFGDNDCRYKIALSFDLRTRALGAPERVARVPDTAAPQTSPDGKWFVAYSDGIITGALVHPLINSNLVIWSSDGLSYSPPNPDGGHVVMRSLRTGTVIRRLTPADAKGPSGPVSPGGRYRQVFDGITLMPKGGPLTVTGTSRAMLSADVSPDGKTIALLNRGAEEGGDLTLRLLTIDGLVARTIGMVPAGYDDVRWDGTDRLVVGRVRQDYDAKDILTIDLAHNGQRRTYAPLCTPVRLAAGMLAPCGRTAGNADGSGADFFVASFDRDGWQPIKLRELEGTVVQDAATAPAVQRAVIRACLDRSCSDSAYWLLDTRTMRIMGRGRQTTGYVVLGIRLSRDGRTLYIQKEEGREVIAFALPDTDGMFDLVPEKPADGAAAKLFLQEGLLPDLGVEWSRIDRNTLGFARSRDHKPIAELAMLPDGGFTVTTPFGTYDTSRRPDNPAVGWTFPDAPMKSLPIEIFMRDYLEPNLLRRRLDCTIDDSCAKAFRPAPDLTAINRVQPRVSIGKVTPGTAAGTVDVTIVANGVVDPTAPEGRRASGVYNIRLYRDDRLVAQEGAPDPHSDGSDRDLWRQRTQLIAPGDPNTFTRTFTVPIPTGKDIAFTAYAFNQDRVKSATALTRFTAPPASPPRRRLYLLTIGIDAYQGPGFPSLRYSGSDAAAMDRLLRTLGPPKGDAPYEIHAESVIGTAAQPVTRERLRAAFARLRDAGPDDAVIISYAGHGFTDAQGRFSLVPSDARSRDGAPDPASLITAGDLAEWLSPVDAGEIAFIIDACHSAASVSAGGFKPGPMGDPGLGQLAYDKGIRILAASQPDQYAMELTSFGHGLLTYALIQGAEKGGADLDRDGVIRLDEWLHYARDALQSFAPPAGSDEDAAPLVVDWGRDVKQARQKPSLFDYVDGPARIGLAVPDAR